LWKEDKNRSAFAHQSWIWPDQPAPRESANRPGATL